MAGAVASVPVAEAFGYTKKLTWVSLDPPLIETFPVITRDTSSLSPAIEAMIEPVNKQCACSTASTSRCEAPARGGQL
ncbi:MAG TPA: hypothetical protein VFY56_06745 [Propionibacteriaceae bacterium]|nr:hypothetical protein [Propionibacteriaceae bacterium]